MITFHSQQADCARHVRKNENPGTINFASQIASSICTVAFTKRVKSDEIIFISRCSRLSLIYIFIHGHALLLSFVRFSRLANGSPANRRYPARWSRNVREPSHKKSGEISRSLPHNFQTIARQWQKQYRRIFTQATCETTRNMARNNPAAPESQSAQQTMQHPAKHRASRLAEVLSSRFQP
jgi:hypothetical protein